MYIEDISHLTLNAARIDVSGYCDISDSQVFRTQVDYLSDVCRIRNVIENTECIVVRDIASDLLMNLSNPDAFAKLLFSSEFPSACCDAGAGVTCDARNHVTRIDWSNMGLTGRLNTSKIELLYSYLESFNVEGNAITGNISPGFTSNIKSLNLANKLITGDLVNIRLNKLQHMDLRNNGFIGIMPQLPPLLKVLYISNNCFFGHMPVIPAFVEVFDISNNRIIGDIYISNPKSVNISNNQISDIIFNSSVYLNICDFRGNTLIKNYYPDVCLLDRQTSTANYSYIASSIYHFASLNDSFATETSVIIKDAANIDPAVSPWLIIGLIIGLVSVILLTFVASKIFKHPELHSRFGRKNSFGTLNTVATKQAKIF